MFGIGRNHTLIPGRLPNQFDVGRATSENVLDAEALVAEERATLAQALYQAHTRRAELDGVSLNQWVTAALAEKVAR